MKYGALYYEYPIYYCFYKYHYDDVRPAHAAAHGLSRVEKRASPCTT